MAINQETLRIQFVDLEGISTTFTSNLSDYYNENSSSHIDQEGSVDLDEIRVFHKVMHDTLENQELLSTLSDEGKEVIEELLWKAAVPVFRSAEVDLTEEARDQQFYDLNPLAYVGMRQSDFL